MGAFGLVDQAETSVSLRPLASLSPASKSPAQGDDIQCPSYQIEEATGVLGRRQENGTVKLFETILPVPDSARPTLVANEALRTTRFVGPCLSDECVYWNQGCRLGTALSRVPGHADSAIPDCPIRDRCRWYLENGSSSCRVCVSVTFTGPWPRRTEQEQEDLY